MAALAFSDFLDNLEDSADVDSFVTLEEISRAMSSSTSPAVGVHGIPQSFIKSAFPTIGPYIRDIFNKLLLTSKLHVFWKQSLVITLNKLPYPSNRPDFRLISLLCFFI